MARRKFESPAVDAEGAAVGAEGAGYDLQDEHQLRTAVLASRAANEVRARLRAAFPGRAAKVGRNDPCPCGSGKKYKRCCLGKVSAEDLASRATEVPVPQLHAADEVSRDCSWLIQQLMETPELTGWLVPRPLLVTWLEELGTPEEVFGPDFDGGRLDGLIERIFERHGGAELVEGFDDALLDRVPAHDGQPENLRALAVGVMLARALRGDDSTAAAAADSLIGLVLLRASFGMATALSQFEERLGTGAAGPGLRTALEDLIGEAPAQAEAWLHEQEFLRAEMNLGLREGRIPFPIPLVSALPSLLELRARGEGDDAELTPETLSELLEQHAARLGDEDDALIAEVFEEWFERGNGTVLERTLARRARATLRDDPVRLRTLHLFGGIKQEVAAPEALGAPDGAILEWPVDFYERYADHLDASGYPGLGSRVRDLLPRLPAAQKEATSSEAEP